MHSWAFVNINWIYFLSGSTGIVVYGLYVALPIAHIYARTTGGTRWKPYVVRVWYNVHLNAYSVKQVASANVRREGARKQAGSLKAGPVIQ